ncbi:hypothetical protein V2J09_019716 [Rumex salicifolius]
MEYNRNRNVTDTCSAMLLRKREKAIWDMKILIDGHEQVLPVKELILNAIDEDLNGELIYRNTRIRDN